MGCPKILVIIVTYNGIRWIERCLSSVKGHDLFIIDNGSTDGTQAFIRSRFPSALFRQSEKNLGFGRANNIGMKYAIDHDYDYVYLMNQDAWVMPGAIKELVEVNKQHPEYGILSPMQMQDGLAYFDNIFGMKVLTWEASKRLIEDWYHGQREDVYEVPFVMAAHWLVSAGCIKKAGLFSPTFPHYGEDDNYIDRARYHGFKTGVVPSAQAVHDRDNGPWNRKKQAYMSNYIIPLQKLSSISNKVSPWPVIVKNAVTYSLIWRSFAPVTYLIRLLREYPAVRRNRDISKQPAAFVNYEW